MSRLLIALLFASLTSAAGAAPYRLTSNSAPADAQSIVRQSDGALIPNDLRNGDYQVFARWLNAGNTPDPATSVAAPITSMQLISTAMPALNGAYAIDVASQQKVQAISLYVAVNGKFPAGQAQQAWPDAGGVLHFFPTTALWQAFASAMADFVAAVDLGQSPAQPVTIP